MLSMHGRWTSFSPIFPRISGSKTKSKQIEEGGLTIAT
jgi:hypothetical protein